jgi:hypothetical protein
MSGSTRKMTRSDVPRDGRHPEHDPRISRVLGESTVGSHFAGVGSGTSLKRSRILSEVSGDSYYNVPERDPRPTASLPRVNCEDRDSVGWVVRRKGEKGGACVRQTMRPAAFRVRNVGIYQKWHAETSPHMFSGHKNQNFRQFIRELAVSHRIYSYNPFALLLVTSLRPSSAVLHSVLIALPVSLIHHKQLSRSPSQPSSPPLPSKPTPLSSPHHLLPHPQSPQPRSP